MIVAQLLGQNSPEVAKYKALPEAERQKIMQALANAITNRQQAADALKNEINKR
jgi:hypothetical protein